ncbi:MAG: hypothetical protein PHI06_13410 [Desulfobulbaceae bacterium]|nr:hypothetical protein [Desulfobulbaceae bacterium]
MDDQTKDNNDQDHGQGSAIKAKVFIGLGIFILCFIANVVTGDAAWVRIPLAILALYLVYKSWFKKSK